MKIKQALYGGTALGLAMLALGMPCETRAQQRPRSPHPQSTTTTSAAWSPAASAPEAGVWVIAETTELGTRFAKIAVTDDLGR